MVAFICHMSKYVVFKKGFQIINIIIKEFQFQLNSTQKDFNYCFLSVHDSKLIFYALHESYLLTNLCPFICKIKYNIILQHNALLNVFKYNLKEYLYYCLLNF
jgi:hypothetical protein